MLNFTIHFSPCNLLYVPVRFRVSISYAETLVSDSAHESLLIILITFFN